MIAQLRTAAQSRDAREILERAAFEYYRRHHPELPGRPPPGTAQALADLAVTGRAAHASFRNLRPQGADLLAGVRRRVNQVGGTADDAELLAVLDQALGRTRAVLWALRGPTDHRIAARDGLGWIAVSGEDDPPHRPVNVLSAPYPQYDLTLQVGGVSVETRYIVATGTVEDSYPVDLEALPAEPTPPVVVGDVILFIHGHSSRLEEALSLIEPLQERGAALGRPVTVIAMDLPSNGYSTMIEHGDVAPDGESNWNTGYPLLDFIEEAVVAFVDALDASQPGLRDQIVGVIGGSLGGNMSLRLARRSASEHPWLRNVVSWSPASSWRSFARATNQPWQATEPGRFFDLVMTLMVQVTRANMSSAETWSSRYDHFDRFPDGQFASQSDRWYSPSWPCAVSAVAAARAGIEEIYNARFRRWHWRVAHEQLIFSHWDSDNPSPSIDPDPRVDPSAGPARHQQIESRLLLAAGAEDDHYPEKIYSNTAALAVAMEGVEGKALLLRGVGHSIHTERPAFFASQILDFLYQSPPPPLSAYLILSAVL